MYIKNSELYLRGLMSQNTKSENSIFTKVYKKSSNKESILQKSFFHK